ncbi:hypothetical protein [Aquipseudomonas campi]
MSEHSALSSEELDFIQRVFNTPTPGKRLQTPTFRVDGGARANTMLSDLGENAQLSLEAHFDGYWMSFPLQLVEDEMHNLQMELGAPSIYEEGDVLRPLRLHLDESMPLLDEEGIPSGLHVEEVSPGGLLVTGNTAMPRRFELWLPLPGHKPMAIKGRLLRMVGKRRAVYALKLRHPEHAERLRQFIFDQYRQQHPQLHLGND